MGCRSVRSSARMRTRLRRLEKGDHGEEINGVPCDKMFGADRQVPRRRRTRPVPVLGQERVGRGNGEPVDDLRVARHRAPTTIHVEEFTLQGRTIPTLGHGHGPTPQEFVLHALAACITAGIATGAAARNIQLHKVSSTVSADIDVRGVLGIDPDIRKGFSNVDIEFDIDADCDDDAERRAARSGGQVLRSVRHAGEPDRGQHLAWCLVSWVSDSFRNSGQGCRGSRRRSCARRMDAGTQSCSFSDGHEQLRVAPVDQLIVHRSVAEVPRRGERRRPRRVHRDLRRSR